MQTIESGVASLADVLARHAAALGGERAFTFLESGEREAASISWRELHDRSLAIASAIRARVEPGTRVLLLFPPGLDFVPALFGAFRARVIAVPAYPPSGARSDRFSTRLRGMIADAGIELVLTTAAIAARSAALGDIVPGLRAMRWLAVDGLVGAADLAGRLEPPAAEEIAFLQYTSGSTTTPRGVIVTHANLLCNLADSARLGGHDRQSVSLSWLPVNHDMGLIQGVLQPVFNGFPGWLMSPVAFLQRPARWLQAITRLRATHSGGPNFAYDLCCRRISDVDRDALDLTSWRVAFSGSEPVRDATIDAFARTFAARGFARQAFRPAYGLAESTLLVTCTSPNQSLRTLGVDSAALRHGRVRQRPDAGDEPSPPRITRLIGCGAPPDTTHLVIVNPETCRRQPSFQVGEIWVAGGSVARGYWRRPGETRTVFGAHLADSGEGPFLRTGDLGFVQDGELFVTGRIKDTIIVRGLKHDPHDIELTVEATDPVVRPGACAAFVIDPDDESVGLAIELDERLDTGAPGRRGFLIEAIRMAVAGAHGIQLAAVILLAPGVLPKTTSGKIQRFACREGLRSGTLNAIAISRTPDAVWPLERSA